MPLTVAATAAPFSQAVLAMSASLLATSRSGPAWSDRYSVNGNGRGLGATVRVFSAGKVYTKYNDGKSGYLSQSARPLYFGLGDAGKIDSVEVDFVRARGLSACPEDVAELRLQPARGHHP